MSKTQLRRKHSPQRSCVACRQKVDKRQLTRLVNTPDEGVVVDPSGKRNGRGAYVCSEQPCRERVVTTGLLAQALKTEIDDETRIRLRSALQLSDEVAVTHVN